MRIPALPRPVAAAAAVAVAGLTLVATGPGADPALADDSLSVRTPYPSVETLPGSDLTLDLAIASSTPEVVDLEVSALPEGWTATLRGGGFVIHSITSAPGDGAPANLEVTIPAGTKGGDYPLTVTAHDATGATAVAAVSLVVADQVNSGIELTADFPSLSGDPGGTFTYTITVDNDTPTEETFTFDPTGPQGWTVTASPTAEAKAQTVTVDAGKSTDVKVTATAPATVGQGTYPIDVSVVGASGGKGTIELQAEVVGTPDLVLGTADERLDVTGTADHEKRIPLIVANTGSAPLDAVKLAGTAPTGWDVSFDPTEVESVKPGETAQVTAIVKPASDAVAGDYSLTVRSSAGSLSSDVDLRYSLEGSRTLGIAAVGVIVVAVAVLVGVFVKFGRALMVTAARRWGASAASVGAQPPESQPVTGRAVPAAVRSEDLTKRYGTLTAVDSLTLTIEPGEVFGLLGPNGAGKTTTILMVLGLTEPTSGRVEVLGVDPTREPLAVKSKVGYLPDEVGFYDDLTARENLGYTARLNRIEKGTAARCIDRALADVGLSDDGDRRVGHFSRGMRQRLGVADALLKEPAILILDEPTVNIDPEGVRELLLLVERLRTEQGVTVLLSSHLLHQVQQVCDRIGIFVAGRLVACGTIDELAAAVDDRWVFTVGVEGVADPAALLRSVPGVRSVERLERRWTVHAGEDVRPDLQRIVVGAGGQFTHLSRDRADLDAIYHRYFRGADGNGNRR